MASVLKLSLAFGLFGLVALAAVLSWYFAYASGSPSADFYLEGTDEGGNQIRLSAGGNPTKVDFEILSAQAETNNWKIFRSATNNAEADSWFGFWSINSGDSAWVCTKVGNGNQDGTTSNTFSQLGSDLFAQYGDAGGVTYFNLIDSVTGQTKMVMPVVFSASGVSNFGGYAVTLFSWGTRTITPFKTGLPALTAESTCVDYQANEATAVVESATAPVCRSFPSLFAFLQKRSYATNSAASFCSGSATAVSCTATTSKTDSLGWSGTDRAFVCTSATYGKIITFSGSDDIVDWLRNLTITSTSFVGMTVHNGFYTKFKLWKTYIDTNASATGKNTFNGHSLGGAIANVAAAYWKNKYPTNSGIAIVTCGAPAPFKGHTSQYNGIPNRRYVNHQEFADWWDPRVNQRDVVSVVTAVAGYSHPVGQLFNTQEGSDTESWSTKSISVVAVVGDVNVMGMHTTYTKSMDKARPTQSTY